MRKSFVLLVTFAIFSALTEQGMACSIAGDPPQFHIQNSLDRAEIVFVGEFQGVKKIETMPPLPLGVINNTYSYDLEVTFKATKFYKGVYGTGVLIKVRTSIGGICDDGIREWENEKLGTPWLVYARLYFPQALSSELLLFGEEYAFTQRLQVADKKNLQFLENNLAERRKRMLLPN